MKKIIILLLAIGLLCGCGKNDSFSKKVECSKYISNNRDAKEIFYSPKLDSCLATYIRGNPLAEDPSYSGQDYTFFKITNLLTKEEVYQRTVFEQEMKESFSRGKDMYTQFEERVKELKE